MNGFQVLIPHPLCDPTKFGSLADLYGIYGRDGYLGGLRLLQVSFVNDSIIKPIKLLSDSL